MAGGAHGSESHRQAALGWVPAPPAPGQCSQALSAAVLPVSDPLLLPVLASRDHLGGAHLLFPGPGCLVVPRLGGVPVTVFFPRDFLRIFKPLSAYKIHFYIYMHE